MGCPQSSFGPEDRHIQRLRRATKDRKILHDHFRRRARAGEGAARMLKDQMARWWTACLRREETHCSYHGSCPEHPPDVEFPWDDYPEESTHPRSRTPPS